MVYEDKPTNTLEARKNKESQKYLKKGSVKALKGLQRERDGGAGR